MINYELGQCDVVLWLPTMHQNSQIIITLTATVDEWKTRNPHARTCTTSISKTQEQFLEIEILQS